MSASDIRSREELGARLRKIARIAARCRAARPAEGREAAPPRDPRQITIGRVLLLVALWAVGLAAMRWTW